MENRVVGIKSREIYECPAAVALIAAHQDLERFTTLGLSRAVKAQLDSTYAELIYEGFWFSPLPRRAPGVQRRARPVRDRRGDAEAVQGLAARSWAAPRAFGVYNKRSPPTAREDQFDHRAAEGFIKLLGLQLQEYSRLHGGGGVIAKTDAAGGPGCSRRCSPSPARWRWTGRSCARTWWAPGPPRDALARRASCPPRRRARIHDGLVALWRDAESGTLRPAGRGRRAHGGRGRADRAAWASVAGCLHTGALAQRPGGARPAPARARAVRRRARARSPSCSRCSPRAPRRTRDRCSPPTPTGSARSRSALGVLAGRRTAAMFARDVEAFASCSRQADALAARGGRHRRDVAAHRSRTHAGSCSASPG